MNEKFLEVGDVMQILGISRSAAYKLMRQINSELEKKLSKGESLDSDMNVQEPVNVIYQTIISVKSLCFSSIVISTDALAYIILGHEEKNTMTFLSD